MQVMGALASMEKLSFSSRQVAGALMRQAYRTMNMTRVPETGAACATPLLPSLCDKPSLAIQAVLTGRLPSHGQSVQKLRSKLSANRTVRQRVSGRLVLNNRNTSRHVLPIDPGAWPALPPQGQVAARSCEPLARPFARSLPRVLPANFSRCAAAWIRCRGGLQASLGAARLRALSGEPVRHSAPSADNKGRRHRTAVRNCLRGRSSLVDLRGRTEGG